MLIKNITKSLLITFTAIITQSQTAQANDFYIKKGSQFELCREIKEILDEPENKDFGVPFLKSSDFPITGKHKNFRLPVWEEIPASDLSKYIKSEKVLKTINDFDDQKEILAPNPDGYNYFLMYGKKYGAWQKFLIQKTYIDFDNDGIRENVIRYKPENTSPIYEDYYRWFHYVEDTARESYLTKWYNLEQLKHQKEGFLFYYKGKIFQYRYLVPWEFEILEPIIGKNKKRRYIINVCSLRLKDWQAANKAVDKYFDKQEKIRKELEEKNKHNNQY